MISGSLQTYLPIVGGLVIILIIVNGLRVYYRNKHVQSQEEKMPEQEEVDDIPMITPKKTEPEDIFFISVHAKPGATFGDDCFLNNLASVGLVFGDNDIFHYDVKTEIGNVRLFSVAKLNKPGIFNLNDPASLCCKGLLFFMHKRHCKRLLLAFDYMLEVAKQLAEDLDGVLYEGYDVPWSEANMRAFRETLE